MVCSVKDCREEAKAQVRTPDPAAWPAGIYDACGYEHAETIVLKLLGRMFLATPSESAFAADLDSPTEPAS